MKIKKTSSRTILEIRREAYILALEVNGKPICSALPTKNKNRFFPAKKQKSPIFNTEDPKRNSIPNRKEVTPWNRFPSISSLP